MNTVTIEQKWTKIAADQLIGRTIVKVKYLSQKEADSLGWSNRPLVLTLDNGNIIVPTMDDEGNDGGAIFTNDKLNSTLPTISA